MTRTITTSVLTYAIILLAAAGCGEPPLRAASTNLSVAVSILPQAWLVSQIGGSHVSVTTLIEPGGSPETYQPTDAQVSQVMRADVYFYIDAPFENGPWFAALKRSGRVKLVNACHGITHRRMGPGPHDQPAAEEHQHEHDGHPHTGPGPHDQPAAEEHQHEHDGHPHTGPDPHVWLTPQLLKTQARTVARVLVELDAPHEANYLRNLAALEASLDELDKDIRRRLDPYRGRAFFVFHPAWGYFADEYSLRQISIEVAGNDPSDHELTQLQQLAQTEGARVIFVQPQVYSRSADAVAQAIGGRVVALDPLAEDVAQNLLQVAQAIADSYR